MGLGPADIARSAKNPADEADIYSASYVIALFNEMSLTYGATNYLSSFGFSARWRTQCVDAASVAEGMVVYDLMSGMGECFHLIQRKLQGRGKIVGVDFSGAMCRGAEKAKARLPAADISIHEEDALRCSLPSGSADRIVCSFGIKTLSDSQKETFADELLRLLKPGGRLSLIEISVPQAMWLRIPYMFYLRRCIPLIGKLLLGNPDNYRMLGVYTARFRSCNAFCRMLAERGMEVQQRDLFFGCATMITGQKSR